MRTSARRITLGDEASGVLRGFPYLLSLFLLILFSCAVTREGTPPAVTHLIEDVPFYPQEAYQCGPSALAGVLNYWGVDVSPQQIAVEIYSESARGTLDMDMVLYAQKKNREVRHYEGGLEDLRTNIDSGYPLIVLVDHGFWIYQKNHFMVVVGYSDDGVVVNSGKNRLKTLALRGFLQSWRRTKFWTLLITPKQ